MKISTAINHRDILIQRVNQIYRDAATFMWTSEQLRATIDLNVYGYEPWKRCPRWMQFYITGYREALHYKHWELIEWVHPWKGKIYKKWCDLPRLGQKYYRRPLKYGIHVYKKDNTKRFTSETEQFALLKRREEYAKNDQ